MSPPPFAPTGPSPSTYRYQHRYQTFFQSPLNHSVVFIHIYRSHDGYITTSPLGLSYQYGPGASPHRLNTAKSALRRHSTSRPPLQTLPHIPSCWAANSQQTGPATPSVAAIITRSARTSASNATRGYPGPAHLPLFSPPSNLSLRPCDGTTPYPHGQNAGRRPSDAAQPRDTLIVACKGLERDHALYVFVLSY